MLGKVWGWVNDRIFIFRWTIPLSQSFVYFFTKRLKCLLFSLYVTLWLNTVHHRLAFIPFLFPPHPKPHILIIYGSSISLSQTSHSHCFIRSRLTLMGTEVLPQTSWIFKASVAKWAATRPLSRVYALVVFQMLQAAEPFPADAAHIWFFTGVCAAVLPEAIEMTKLRSAIGAGIWFLTSVDAEVSLKSPGLAETAATDGARIRFLSRVDPQVLFQTRDQTESLAALQTQVRTFPRCLSHQLRDGAPYGLFWRWAAHSWAPACAHTQTRSIPLGRPKSRGSLWWWTTGGGSIGRPGGGRWCRLGLVMVWTGASFFLDHVDVCQITHTLCRVLSLCGHLSSLHTHLSRGRNLLLFNREASVWGRVLGSGMCESSAVIHHLTCDTWELWELSNLAWQLQFAKLFSHCTS